MNWVSASLTPHGEGKTRVTISSYAWGTIVAAWGIDPYRAMHNLAWSIIGEANAFVVGWRR